MHLSLRRPLCLALIFLLVPHASPTAGSNARPEVDCRACLVVTEDGTRLFQRSANQPLPNASTTKMVTALVVRELEPNLDQEVRVSAGATAVPGGRLSLARGEVLTVAELLSVLLLASSNQAAMALAEHAAGSEVAFVSTMNEKADELGAEDTTFANPHGLDAPGHAATAADLALIGAAVLADPVLADIVERRSVTVETSARTVEITNTNELIGSYRGAIGVKTGFTADAGNVLVAAAERHGRRLISVVMGSDDSFAASSKLLDFGFSRLARGILLAKMTPMTDIVFDPGGTLTGVVARTVRGITDPDEIEVRFEPDPSLELPVAAGARVGTAIVVDGTGTEVGSSPVIAPGGASRRGDEPWTSAVLGGVIATVAGVLPGDGS